MNDLSFFATQGPLSRPGTCADLFDSFPTAIGELCAVVQGVTLHPFWAERYGATLAAERGAEVQLRTMEKHLARTLELDSRPLGVPRDCFIVEGATYGFACVNRSDAGTTIDIPRTTAKPNARGVKSGAGQCDNQRLPCQDRRQ